MLPCEQHCCRVDGTVDFAQLHAEYKEIHWMWPFKNILSFIVWYGEHLNCNNICYLKAAKESGCAQDEHSNFHVFYVKLLYEIIKTIELKFAYKVAQASNDDFIISIVCLLAAVTNGKNRCCHF